MKLLIEGGRLVDPMNGIDEADMSVLVVDGRVAEVGRGLSVSDAEVVDARGRVIAPGFVDMHVHLREPGGEESETIRTGCAAAAAGGFTGVAAMPNTTPVNDDPTVTRFMIEQAEAAGSARLWPIAAATIGSRGDALSDYGLLKEAGAVAVSDDGHPIASSEMMRRALEYARQFGMVVIDHCEDPTLSRGWCMHEGAASTRLGLPGMHAASEEIMLVRDAILARETDSRVHIAHISTRGSVARVREEKSRGVAITAEVTQHHFCLTDAAIEDYDTNAKMNPPLRTDEDVAAVLEALRDGTIDCIATDHAPHHIDKKRVEFALAANGIIGLECAIPLACDRLLHGGVVDIKRLIELMSCNPARILGIDAGCLAVGRPADITVLDLDREVVVDVSRFASLSRNSPFNGMKLKGGPTATIVGGRIVWRAGTAPGS